MWRELALRLDSNLPAEQLGQRTIALCGRVLIAKRSGDIRVPATVQQLGEGRSLLGILVQARVPQIVEAESWSACFLSRTPPGPVQSALGRHVLRGHC